MSTTTELRPVTVESLRAMEDALWKSDDLDLYRRGYGLSQRGKRRHRDIYRAAECLGYGFTPYLWGEWDGFAEVRCNECGHRLSFNKLVGSWARKHHAKHRGVEPWRVWANGADIMHPRD